ncbi:MAG: tRNA dihydrouridine(20/20a) synthase DusA [Succinivibrio sp.]|nr:tRNA dihydrouridine(20/20a) synthase DusA [Succinivibrio sp.]
MTAFLPCERFAVAPMVDVTDSHFRRVMRLFSRRCALYTEMIAAEALLHGRLDLLDYDPVEAPLILQLGGCVPQRLAQAAKLGEERGFAAINLNAGCPSDKVQQGSFGAVLMKDLPLLGECAAALCEAVSCPVSVKTRIGVDEQDSEEFTLKLVETLYRSGVRHVILHARKAWLKGLSPKQNRSVPPLNYERVYLIKRSYPDLYVTLNGGLTTLEQCQTALQRVDGVMLGRAVLDNPLLLTGVDESLFAEGNAVLTLEQHLERGAALLEQLEHEGRPAHLALRHFINLCNGRKGARLYRQYLSTHLKEPHSAVVLRDAFALLEHKSTM